MGHDRVGIELTETVKLIRKSIAMEDLERLREILKEVPDVSKEALVDHLNKNYCLHESCV